MQVLVDTLTGSPKSSGFLLIPCLYSTSTWSKDNDHHQHDIKSYLVLYSSSSLLAIVKTVDRDVQDGYSAHTRNVDHLEK